MILLLFSPQELLPDESVLLAFSFNDASGGLFSPAVVPETFVKAALFPSTPDVFISRDIFPSASAPFVSQGVFLPVSGAFVAWGVFPTVPDVLSGERPEEAILIPSSVSIALSRFSGMGSAISPVRLPVWRTQSSWSARVAAT